MVAYSDQALDQLQNIRTDERFTPTARLAKARKIVSLCETLDIFPNLGHAGREPDTRELTILPFVIVYELRAKVPNILFIWHGRQSRITP